MGFHQVAFPLPEWRRGTPARLNYSAALRPRKRGRGSPIRTTFLSAAFGPGKGNRPAALANL